jgi:hypothetical protein
VEQDSTGWSFLAPNGDKFFSLGICVFDQGAPKEKYNPARPQYAGLRHYDSVAAWSDVNLQRLKSWGFTTLGGWSAFQILDEVAEHDLWITPVISLGARSGAPWFDMWDPTVVQRIEELAEETIPPFRHDPRVIGYYSDNEIGWWNAILWKMTLEQPATSGQRQRLIQLVRDTYANDWNAMAADFEPQDASNWQELEVAGMLWLRPGSKGIRTMRQFLGSVAGRYYELMDDSIRKFDPQGLYLGDRYQSFYYPELPAAGRKHLDVVSTNLNASWNDGTFLRSYLETLHNLTGRPIIVSEFYVAAAENRSGNKNSTGGFPTVATQSERQAALANTLDQLAGLPFVVGADWFQYYDEPPHGREKDGEDFNFGLIDIHDQPYAEVTATLAAQDWNAVRASPPRKRADATNGVPPAPSDPFANFESMKALKGWDRDRGFIPAATSKPVGDGYICWSPQAIYLATYVIDIAEPDYYRNGEIPEVDRSLWTFRLNDGPMVTARVGAGKLPEISHKGLRIQCSSGIYHDVRCVTAVEIPASLVGKDRFEKGDHISLDISFDTFARADRIEWKGEFVLAD